MLTCAGHAAQSGDLGIAAYMTKPILPSELLDALLKPVGSAPRHVTLPKVVPRHTVQENQPSADILLAEDNPVNQRLAIRLLEKIGHSVTLAENGLQAVAATEKQTFDL